jgi:hypothetical protein
VTDIEDVGAVIQTKWYQSKALVGTLVAHVLTASGALVGLLMDHHAAATIVPAQLASHVAIHTGHTISNAAIDRSPNSPDINGRYPPQPAVVIPPTVTSVTIAPPVAPAPHSTAGMP